MSDNLFLTLDPRDLLSVTKALVDTFSPSKQEDKICSDLIEYIKSFRQDVDIVRIENSFVVRVNHKADVEPIIFAGHLDTVPPAEFEGVSNARATIKDDLLYGLGASDMKSGLALMIALLADINVASTFIFYEAEEIEIKHSGLVKIQDSNKSLLEGKWAILLEPTEGQIELGCQGTLSAKAIFRGKRAHSARPWMGDNAIHKAVGTLQNITQKAQSQPQLEVEGLTYSSALSVTTANGGVARNVIPDYFELVINHRYTPNISSKEAEEYIVNEVCLGADEVEIIDNVPGAMPALEHEMVGFAKQKGIELVPKVAWTDVAQFYKLRIPAINFGPGDPTYAHRADEHLVISKLEESYILLKEFVDSI